MTSRFQKWCFEPEAGYFKSEGILHSFNKKVGLNFLTIILRSSWGHLLKHPATSDVAGFEQSGSGLVRVQIVGFGVSSGLDAQVWVFVGFLEANVSLIGVRVWFQFVLKSWAQVQLGFRKQGPGWVYVGFLETHYIIASNPTNFLKIMFQFNLQQEYNKSTHFVILKFVTK